jgi:transposase
VEKVLRRLRHVKSLRAHAIRSLISARKKLVGQRVTLENQTRGLAVVFGIRLTRALTAAFIDKALRSSEGIRLDIVINAARKQAGLAPRGSLNETHGHLGAKARMRCGF